MLCPAKVEEAVLRWHAHNAARCEAAGGGQRAAEAANAEAGRVGRLCVQRALSSERLSDLNLRERVDEVRFQHSQLDLSKRKLEAELATLAELIERVQIAAEKCHEPLQLSTDCLKIREGRESSEKAADPVTRSLVLEEGKISSALSNLRRLQRDLIEQQRLLRIAVYQVNKDTSGKEAALSVDKRCLQLSVNSENLTDELSLSTNKSSSEAQWAWHTEQNLSQADNQVKRSREMRSRAEILLRAACEDICKVFQRTNDAFEKRIFETKQSKQKLEHELAQTTQKIIEVRSILVELEQPIAVNKDHMKLAVTRLNERELRPGVEKCSDQAERQLKKELSQLQSDCDRLEKQRQNSVASLQALQRTCQLLTQELELKALSLMLDEVRCLTLRASLNVHTIFMPQHPKIE
ncbi:tektin-1-like [Cloeon dipterum]|uniref:tektin-1-like n=1 Tax=Cloeon dipterum TaxID=197152 RepID=UPI00321FA82A